MTSAAPMGNPSGVLPGFQLQHAMAYIETLMQHYFGLLKQGVAVEVTLPLITPIPATTMTASIYIGVCSRCRASQVATNIYAAVD